MCQSSLTVLKPGIGIRANPLKKPMHCQSERNLCAVVIGILNKPWTPPSMNLSGIFAISLRNFWVSAL
jgi:hypothetical protein